jgi:DNA-binding HxlR family transcriptional regulator
VDVAAVYQTVDLLNHVLTVEILQATDGRPQRYTDILGRLARTHAGAVHGRSFRDTLQRLHAAGLIERRVDKDAVLYCRTRAGELLLDVAKCAETWANQNALRPRTGDEDRSSRVEWPDNSAARWAVDKRRRMI